MKKNYLIILLLALMAGAQAQNLSAGLIAHYTFDNGSFTDQTTNGNDATNSGTVPFLDIDLVEDEAILFDTNTFISLPEDILLRDQLSISLWFKTSKSGLILGTQNKEALDSNGVSNSYFPNIYIDSRNVLRAGFWTGNGAQQLSSSINFADNKWHHLVLIADNSRQYLYVDNKNIATDFYNRTVLPSLKYAQLGVGKVANYPNNGGQVWMDFDGGRIDNVRIYGNAITPFFVRDIFNLEKADASSIAFGLVGHYKFDNGSMRDVSENNNDLTNNGTTATFDIDSVTDMATAFGLNNYLSLPDRILLQQNISVSLWFNTDETGAILAYQAGNPFSGATTHVPIIYFDQNKTLRVAFWSGAIRTVNGTNTNYADDEWHHLVLTASDSFQELYMDNQLVMRANFGHAILSNMFKAQLGLAKVNGWPGNNSETWMDFNGGVLDNVRIYHTTLDATKVDLIHQEEKAQTISGFYKQNSREQLAIYPNPTTGIIFTEKGKIEIVNMLGKTVYVASSNGSVDLSNLETGIYTVFQNGKNSRLVID